MEVLLQLIVDDGVASRGHRKNIFNPAWTHHACFTGPHGVYGIMTCQNFVTGVAPLGAENPTQTTMDSFMKEPVDITAEDGKPNDSDIISTRK